MFEHILLAVDGSAAARAALDKARGLAHAFGSAVTVVYVVDPYPFTAVGPEFAYAQSEFLSVSTRMATEVLDDARTQLAELGARVDTRVVEGIAPWRGILQAADDVHADLIVMGSQGRSGLEKWVLGSQAQRVLQHAHLPVLVVREAEAPAA